MPSSWFVFKCMILMNQTLPPSSAFSNIWVAFLITVCTFSAPCRLSWLLILMLIGRVTPKHASQTLATPCFWVTTLFRCPPSVRTPSPTLALKPSIEHLSMLLLKHAGFTNFCTSCIHLPLEPHWSIVTTSLQFSTNTSSTSWLISILSMIVWLLALFEFYMCELHPNMLTYSQKGCRLLSSLSFGLVLMSSLPTLRLRGGGGGVSISHVYRMFSFFWPILPISLPGMFL